MWLFPHMTKVTCLHSHNFMNERHYNIMKTALKLACLELERSNIEITKDNIEILPYKMHNCLMGYYLMKAEKLVGQQPTT